MSDRLIAGTHMQMNHLVMGIIIVLVSSTMFANAESESSTIDLACEITCGTMKGVQKIEQDSEDSDVPLEIKGTWENHIFVVKPAKYKTLELLCEMAASYVAVKSFHDLLDVRSMDLAQCETRPVAIGWLGLRTYEVMPQDYDRGEL